MKYNKSLLHFSVTILLLSSGVQSTAQEISTLTLESVTEMALLNNHLLNIKKLQVEEKEQKVNEDRINFLPVVGLGGTYQYNSSLPGLIIPQGRFGYLPYGGVNIPLPSTDEQIIMGKHDIYNAGITIYQPVSQIGKISYAVKLSKTDLRIAKTEENKAVIQIRQAVEKLYFGLLIVQKQIDEAGIRVKLADLKVKDIENALLAGKTTESNIYGLAASAADEQQNLLKLKIQYDDYEADLKHLAGIDPVVNIAIQPFVVESLTVDMSMIDTILNEAVRKNDDLILASLQKTKAGYSVMAGKYSYLPDLGLIGGYTYQKGTVIYPENNTYIGASLKWNLHDLLSGRAVVKQRTFMLEQAEENLANTREKLAKEIASACRKIRQTEELSSVAGKVVKYRMEDLKIKETRALAGLNTETELLEAQAALAKAEADYFAARMNYRISLSELRILTGSY